MSRILRLSVIILLVGAGSLLLFAKSGAPKGLTSADCLACHNDPSMTKDVNGQPAGSPEGRTFRAPAMPLEQVIDPTGAGDSFAGGFFGYLASQPEPTPGAFRRAMFYGSVMGSFACERFGTERLQQLTRAEIDERFHAFRELTHLD